MGLNSLTLDLPVMTSLDLSMLGIKNLTLNCNKLVYANLRGSYKLESAVSLPRLGSWVVLSPRVSYCCLCRCFAAGSAVALRPSLRWGSPPLP